MVVSDEAQDDCKDINCNSIFPCRLACKAKVYRAGYSQSWLTTANSTQRVHGDLKPE
jgi:hypothetical protein